MKAITAKDPEQTRQQLLEAAFEEMHEHGFQSASLERILAKTSLTKGALYHHFPSKHALGLAVVDELIAEVVREWRIAPLARHDDPLEAILAAARAEVDTLTEEDLDRGCPLNNLVQEMSPLDPEFREHLLVVLNSWHRAIADALKGGQAKGYVRKDVDPEDAAWFVVIVYIGTINFCRLMDADRLHRAVFSQILLYAHSLRP